MTMSTARMAALTARYLTHTCTLTGPGPAVAFDDWEVPIPAADTAPQTGVRCFAAQPLGQGELITAGESIVTHEWHVLIPADVAVTEAHRVTDVRDEAGQPIAAGPLNVTEVRRLVGHTTLICTASTGQGGQS
jgi:hypothetical protein